MKIKTTAAAIAVSLTIMAGCEAETGTQASQAPALPQKAEAPDQDPVLVTINDTSVTANMLGLYYRERRKGQPAANDAAAQNQALNELIKIVLLAQDAQAKQLDGSKEAQALLELKRMEVLSSIALSQYARDHVPGEEQLRKVYNEKYASAGAGEEYHARHILVKTEDEAKGLITQLNDGADFAELAQAHSTGPTGKKGGDLGWFGAGQMVKPFSDAVAALEKGAVTQSPVNTQFGWHVIKLEDKRSKEPPAFETVQQQLTVDEQRRQLSEYVNELSQKASVQVNEKFSKAGAKESAKE
jgi:peptidyl-prolyl cis-trans isomerase C